MSQSLTDLFTTAVQQSVESIAEWGGGPSKPCPCCEGTGEHDEGECQLCDGGMTVSSKTPDDAKGRDCHRMSSKTAGPAEESQYTPPPVGRPDEEPHTREEGVHRGMTVVLPKKIHDFVHDPNQPAPAKAHLLLSEVRKQHAKNQGPEGEEGSTGGLGNYWSPSKDKAAEYTSQAGWGAYREHEREHNCGDEETGMHGCHTTNVVVHADTPPEKDHWHEQMREGEKYDPEISWRLPVRPGAKMNIRGVSWREGDDHKEYAEREAQPNHHTETPFTRYDFGSPVRKQAELEARDDGGDIPSRFLNQHGIKVRVHTAGYGNVEMVPTHELAPYATQATDADHAKEVAAHFAEKGHMEPLMLQYHPGSGEAYLGEGNHRLRAARVLGMDHVPVRVSRNMYGLGGEGAPAPKRHPNEATGEHIPADIRPSDIGFSGKTLERRTAAVSFGPGADHGEVGEGSYEGDDGFHRRMWDQWHPKLQNRVYRHLALDLPGSHPAHNEKLPMDERAMSLLHSTIQRGNVGVHWTDDPGYQHLTNGRLGPGETPVVLHAKTPERHHIEDNSYVLEDRAVRDWDADPEREVPLKRNAPMDVQGVTWHSAKGPVTHTFDRPIRVHAGPSSDEVTCSKGHTHWGERGAAGLLIRHTDLEGTHHYLLQQRSKHVDHPNTYSIPGGAMEKGESPFGAGVREGDEELGGLPTLGHIGTHSNDHGGWSYHTVIADSPEKFTPTEDGTHSHEADGHKWFTANQIDGLSESGGLHPGFAESWPEVRHRAETEVPHRQMRLFSARGYVTPGTMGKDNEGHRVQMTTMDGWAHDDGSHGHEDNSDVGDHPVYTKTHTWLPNGRYWGPNSAQNDQRIFEGDKLRPEVRRDILDRVGRVLGHLYKGWESWAKVYFAGSEAAKWQPFNGDFDVLIGIDWPEFREQNPDDEELLEQEIAQQMTDALWSKANVDNYFFELADGRKVGPFDRTFFVNPRAWDIKALKPYAAYNVTDDDWAVHPLEVPKDWSATHLPESYWDYAETLLHEIEAIGTLPAEERQRMAANLWEELHTHRSDAFEGNGKGLFDLSNVVEKYLDQHPDKPWEKLRQWKAESPSGPSPWVPTTASRTLSGLFAEGGKGADTTGLMVAIIPPKSVSRKLLVEGGEPLEALHVTLAYLGSKGEHKKAQVDGLESLVRAWARTQKPFTAHVGGAGTFTNPGNHVLWAAVDIPGGGEIRQSLSELLEEHGYKVRNDHGWTPHITLKYHNSHVRFLPKIEPVTWDVKEIMLCIGGHWEPIPLGS